MCVNLLTIPLFTELFIYTNLDNQAVGVVLRLQVGCKEVNYEC